MREDSSVLLLMLIRADEFQLETHGIWLRRIIYIRRQVLVSSPSASLVAVNDEKKGRNAIRIDISSINSGIAEQIVTCKETTHEQKIRARQLHLGLTVLVCVSNSSYLESSTTSLTTSFRAPNPSSLSNSSFFCLKVISSSCASFN